MELQTIFNMVIQHLVRQNTPSLEGVCNTVQACAYRGDNCTKCAAGYLISDKYYDKDIEGTNALDPRVRGMISKTINNGVVLGTHTTALVNDLQGLHDVEYHNALAVSDWYPQDLSMMPLYQEVHKIAKRYGLIVPKVFESYVEGLLDGK